MLRLSLGTGYNSMIAAFKDWIQLRIDLGQPLPSTITGDSCCKTRRMLCALFPHLARRFSCHPTECPYRASQSGFVRVNEVATFEDLTYPCTPIIVDSKEALEHAVVTLGARADSCAPGLCRLSLGLDAEWEYHPERHGDAVVDKVSLLQLALDGENPCIYLIRLCRFPEYNQGFIPHCLSMFLQRRDIIFTGRQIGGDRRKLGRDFKIPSLVEESFTNWIELGKLASQCGKVVSGAVGLKELCYHVLKKNLPKESGTRKSAWGTSGNLSKEQIHYAALDAWASVRIFSVLAKSDNVTVRIGDVDRLSGSVVQ